MNSPALLPNRRKTVPLPTPAAAATASMVTASAPNSRTRRRVLCTAASYFALHRCVIAVLPPSGVQGNRLRHPPPARHSPVGLTWRSLFADSFAVHNERGEVLCGHAEENRLESIGVSTCDGVHHM